MLMFRSPRAFRARTVERLAHQACAVEDAWRVAIDLVARDVKQIAARCRRQPRPFLPLVERGV
jgi:hypothetical protein